MTAPLEAQESRISLSMDKTAAGPGSDRPARKTPRLADLLPRLLSSFVLMALALAAWWFGGAFFVVVWLVAAVAILYEWQAMAGGPRIVWRFGLGALVLGAIAVFVCRYDFVAAGMVLAAGALLVAAMGGPGLWLWAGSGLLYAGCFIASLCLLSLDGAYGPRAILWLFAIVWGTDVCAYFAGRLIGGPKIWPRISPGKTWSGTLIGIGCGALLGTFVGVKGLASAAVLHVLALSLIAAAVAQAGDMFESGMKRHFGVKDSSRLIPGHGGVMDRLDGFVAAALFAVAAGLAARGPTLAAGLFG